MKTENAKDLKKLAEHNAAAMEYYKSRNDSKNYNGIACPECGEELYDSDKDSLLMSYPPKKVVCCCKCHYRGYRIC